MSSPATSPQRRRQPRMPIDVRRGQVLDAALRLILQQGYAAATMEAIAREAQLAKPRVYTAYPGRGPLLLALLEREERRVVAALADAMPAFTDDADFAGTLLAATTNLLTAVAADPDPWRLLMVAADEAPAEVRGHVAAGRRFALERLRDLLAWGRDREPALAQLDLELAARSILAIGEQAVQLTLTDPEKFTVERYAEFARATLRMAGVTPASA